MIRALIYTVLRPYVGRIEHDERDVLGRREQWCSRHQHRKKIAQQWQIFRAQLPDQASIQTPKMASPTTIMLKMLTEFDGKTSPDFSRYLHKLHARLCLLSDLPSLVDDLAPITMENNYLDDSKTYLKDAQALMTDIDRLSKPRPYWDIRRFSLVQTEAENIARQNIAHRLHKLFKAVVEHIEYAIPLFIAWMNAYDTIAECADMPLKKHLMLVSDWIDQRTEENTDEYQQKYYPTFRGIRNEKFELKFLPNCH